MTEKFARLNLCRFSREEQFGLHASPNPRQRLSPLETAIVSNPAGTVSRTVSIDSVGVVKNSGELAQIVIDFIGDFAIFLALHRTFQVAARELPPCFVAARQPPPQSGPGVSPVSSNLDAHRQDACATTEWAGRRATTATSQLFADAIIQVFGPQISFATFRVWLNFAACWKGKITRPSPRAFCSSSRCGAAITPRPNGWSRRGRRCLPA